MKQAAAAPPAGDASDALFERNVEAFRRYRPEAWAVLSRLPGPFSRLVVEDGEGVPQGILHIHDCLRAGLT